MVTSSIMKDMQPNLEVVYRANAIRALCRITDVRLTVSLSCLAVFFSSSEPNEHESPHLLPSLPIASSPLSLSPHRLKPSNPSSDTSSPPSSIDPPPSPPPPSSQPITFTPWLEKSSSDGPTKPPKLSLPNPPPPPTLPPPPTSASQEVPRLLLQVDTKPSRAQVTSLSTTLSDFSSSSGKGIEWPSRR